MIVSTTNELIGLRASGALLASILTELSGLVVPGVSTAVLEAYARKKIDAVPGAQASFLGYRRYPNALCISINNEVVHGMSLPKRTLNTGDIVSLDMGVAYHGLYTDSALTVPVGNIPKNATLLINRTQRALNKAITVVRAGAYTGDIGHAIESYIKPFGYGIVTALVGHGLGRDVHEHPEIPNYGTPRTGVQLKEGMVLAIEPMISLGSGDVDFSEDGWTVLTREHCLSAHFEHTVVVTKTGCEILTYDHSRN